MIDDLQMGVTGTIEYDCIINDITVYSVCTSTSTLYIELTKNDYTILHENNAERVEQIKLRNLC